MGQDTYVNIGVSVVLQLNWHNIKLIWTLINARENDKIHCHITGASQGDDEFIYLDESHYDWATTDFMKMLTQSSTEEEFIQNADDYIRTDNGTSYKDICFNFLVECFQAIARNISHRYNPSIYHHNDHVSVMQLSIRLDRARQILESYCVDERMISIGYSFIDL